MQCSANNASEPTLPVIAERAARNKAEAREQNRCCMQP